MMMCKRLLLNLTPIHRLRWMTIHQGTTNPSDTKSPNALLATVFFSKYNPTIWPTSLMPVATVPKVPAEGWSRIAVRLRFR
jgi:hypothetical protein